MPQKEVGILLLNQQKNKIEMGHSSVPRSAYECTSIDLMVCLFVKISIPWSLF